LIILLRTEMAVPISLARNNDLLTKGPRMGIYPAISMTEAMVNEAALLESSARVNRTKASEIDTLAGILGEFAFAQYFYNDWRQHRVGANKGAVDFDDIEIKASALPFHGNLHLLVREDYAAKRKPQYYVQVILDVPSKDAISVPIGTPAYICGFATSSEVDNAPKKDFGSKFGGAGGYKCHYIPIRNLHAISELDDRVTRHSSRSPK
jgi:hypothetical protein